MAKRSQPKPRSEPPDAGRASSSFSTALPPSASGQAPARRSTYVEAVAVYEKGIEALQRHDYGQAFEKLQSVLTLYPEERELHERVRLYLNICEQHAAPRQTHPQTVDERLYAATLATNGGHYDEAIKYLRLVRDDERPTDSSTPRDVDDGRALTVV